MSRLIAISFENGSIRCVSADVRGEAITIVQSSLLPEDQLESYLATEKASSFIVIHNFKELHQDTLYLPTLEAQQLPLVISGEIRRNHPEIQNYSFFYRVIGDSYQDGRMYKKTAVFIYANEDLTAVVNRFIACKKTVTALYSSTAALAQLLSTSPDCTDDTILGIADLGREKIMFALENRNLSFVREFQSVTGGFAPEDMQSINMTIDYCFQSLRLRPTKAVLLNSPEDLAQSPVKMFVPLAPFTPAINIAGTPETITENAIALGAFACLSAGEVNILPDAYATYFSRRSFFRRGIAAVVLLSIVALLAIAYELFEIISLKSEAASLRHELSLQGKVLNTYEQLQGELATHEPLITFITTAHATVDTQRTLIALNRVQVPGVQLHNITLTGEEDGALLIALAGHIDGTGLATVQQRFEAVIAACTGISGMEIISRSLGGKDQTFSIEARRRNL